MGQSSGLIRLSFEQPAWYEARLSAQKLGFIRKYHRRCVVSERIRVSEEKWRGRLGNRWQRLPFARWLLGP